MNIDNKKIPIVSFRRRYLFKLTTNLVGFVVGIGTQSMVPRALGPAAYGDFSFLTNFFQQVVGFLNLNSSTAFYTKLSQRQQDRGLVIFYGYFTLSLGLALGFFLVFCFAADLGRNIWPGQIVLFIFFGALWAYMTFCATVLGDMSDAYGLTVRAELVKMTLKIFSFLLVVILFWQHWFSLLNFFLFHFIILLLTVWLLFRVIREGGVSYSGRWRMPREQRGVYFREFAAFCTPLVVFTAFAVFEGILDRWFLQKFSGSVEQGLYSLAYQIGAICFLFASAMVPLVARELAVAFGKFDLDGMNRVFMRSTPLIYAIVAYFSCFLAVEARNVMLLFGGDAYAGAVVPISIMCFFPIHQTYGQLNASVFFATNRTLEYKNIGIALLFIGLPLTFFLLGPRSYGALQAGATGLAIKMVLLNILSVNIQLWYNTRFMNLSFKYFFGHQLLVVAAFSTIALICSYAVRTLWSQTHFGVQFLASGFFYTVLIAGLGIAFPRLFALRREEIIGLLTLGRRT